MKRLILLAAAVLAAAITWADSTWIKGSTGGWADAKSWADGNKPTSGSTVIVPEDCDMPVFDDDMAIASDVAEIKTSATTSRVVFSNDLVAATYNGKVTGSGYFVKKGTNTLSLVSTGEYDYYTDGGTVVDEGTLMAPTSFSGTYSTRKMRFGHLSVAAGATFHPAAKYCCTYLRSLSGKGRVANLVGGGFWQTLIDGTSTFEGEIVGLLRLTVSSKVDLLSNKNSFQGEFTATGSGADVGATVLGYGAMTETSVGRCKTSSSVNPLTFQNSAKRFRYLGTGGTSGRIFNLNVQDMTFDGGPYGGLTMGDTFNSWNGSGTCRYTFSGTNASPCIVQGTWNEADTLSTYVKKTGSGTWSFHGTNLNFKGVVNVAEGTFGFDNLAEAGTPCSFGLSTMLAKEYITSKQTFDDAPKADYAILLGGADTVGTIEYEGTVAGDNGVTNRPIAVTGKGGRILVNGDDRMVAFKGVFAADETGSTLTLDGTSPRSYLYDVTDKHGPLSLTKKGTGTWVLGGDQTFSGKLDVQGGELIVSSTLGKSYSWYRFTVRETWAKPKGAANSTCWRCKEFVINDKNGTRLNRAANFTEATTNTVLSTNQISVWQNSTIAISYAKTAIQLVDEWVNWSKERAYYSEILCGGKYPRMEDRSTWIPIVMRLPEGSAEVAYYDAISLSTAGTGNEPYSFTMEASADGVFWDKISDVTTNAVQFNEQNWWTSKGSTVYSTIGSHKGFKCDGPDLHKSLRTTDPVQDFAAGGVSVAAGATLRAQGAVTLKALEVDVAGAGTVDGFAFASSGTINVTGDAGKGSVELPVTLANVQGTPDFSKWTVKKNGRKWACTLAYDAERGKLTLRSIGFAIFFK